MLFWKRSFLGVDRSLSAWPFTDPFFNTWWVARGVLKGFCRLEMCFDIKDRLFLELVAFVLRLCPEIWLKWPRFEVRMQPLLAVIVVTGRFYTRDAKVV